MIAPERAAHCANCRAAIDPVNQVYTMRVDLFASATPPEFDEHDLIADHRAEWERLLTQMAGMSPKEVQEETSKVHERYEFTLCAKCREHFHGQLEALGS